MAAAVDLWKRPANPLVNRAGEAGGRPFPANYRGADALHPIRLSFGFYPIAGVDI